VFTLSDTPENAVFHEPNGIHRGRDEIDRIAGVIKATHSDFRYQPLSPPDVMGDGGRVRWVSGSPGKPPAYAGTDFIIARDGKIAASISSLTSCRFPTGAPFILLDMAFPVIPRNLCITRALGSENAEMCHAYRRNCLAACLAQKRADRFRQAFPNENSAS
jgi:hypothetical protein